MSAPLCRPACPDDMPQILSYVRELAALEGRPEAVTATLSDLVTLLFAPRPSAEAVMILDPASDTPVGYAWFYTITSTYTGKATLYLEDIFITPPSRGRGLGARMMAWLAGAALKRGCAGMEWSVVEGNGPAIRFYEQLGANSKHGSVRYQLSGGSLQRLASEPES